MSAPVFLCALDDIPDGGARGFAVTRTGSGAVFAVRRGRSVFIYRDLCPHEGARLAWRRDAYLSADACRIVCWAHGAHFDIETGQCVAGPCLGQRLSRVAFELEGVGAIHLKGLA